MRQLPIYLFFINVLISGILVGQDEENNKTDEKQQISARDTLPPAEKYGVRVGIDVGRLIRTAASENYEGLEIVGDFRIYRDYYLAGEIGNESLIRDEENINVEGSGSYIRLGFDYNSYDNWYGMQNNINAGLRYGFSTFSQTLNSYRVFTSSALFPNEVRTEKRESEGLTASWIELVVGLKVETLKNLYLGANVSLRRLVSETSPDKGFDNLFIPGFGRTNDFGRFGVGYNYTLSYLIPLKKKKR